MRIRKMGWLIFIAISIMTSMNGQSFASESLSNTDDLETELSLPSRKYRKMLTGRVSADNQEKQAVIEDKIQSVNDTISLKTPCNKATNSDEADYDKCENAIAQLFYPVILDLDESHIATLQETKSMFFKVLNDIKNESVHQKIMLKNLKLSFNSSLKIIDDYCDHATPKIKKHYQFWADSIRWHINKHFKFSLNQLDNCVVRLNEDFQKTFAGDFEFNKFDIMFINLFDLILIYMDEPDAYILKETRHQFLELTHNMIDKKVIKDSSWLSFFGNFNVSLQYIDNSLENSESLKQELRPQYTGKLKALIKLDINRISLENFCRFIMKFDDTLQRAFFKPGGKFCSNCKEESRFFTKFLGKTMLECRFCGNEQFL